MRHELTEALKQIVLTETEWVTVLAALKMAVHYEEAPAIRLGILIQLTKQAT